jgi:DNA adenine methylase
VRGVSRNTSFRYPRFRVSSPFRYPGGKADVVPILRHYRPMNVKELREPFCGGGSFVFETRFVFERIWLNDLHPGLMSVYEALCDRPDEFIRKCRAIPPGRPDDPLTGPGVRGGAPKNARLSAMFDHLKLNEECDQALRYFFVNRTVHGSGRVNYGILSRLYFSNPAGWNIVDTDALEQAAAALRNVRLSCGDYNALLEAPGDDVFIYCDSPYVVNSHLSPTAQLYQFNFTEEDHWRFAEAVRNCKHKVMVSYDDDQDGLVRELFPASDYWIEELAWAYAGTTEKEKKIGRELLIMNYKPPVWDAVHGSREAR